VLECLGSRAGGAISESGGGKVSPGDFYTLRGCMNQMSPESLQTTGNCEQNNRCAARGEENQGLGLKPESSLLRLWVMGGADDAVVICLCLAMVVAGVVC